MNCHVSVLHLLGHNNEIEVIVTVVKPVPLRFVTQRRISCRLLILFTFIGVFCLSLLCCLLRLSGLLLQLIDWNNLDLICQLIHSLISGLLVLLLLSAAVVLGFLLVLTFLWILTLFLFFFITFRELITIVISFRIPQAMVKYKRPFRFVFIRNRVRACGTEPCWNWRSFPEVREIKTISS